MKLRVLVAVSAATLTLTACSSSDSSDGTSPDATQGKSQKLVETSPLTGESLPDGRPSNPVFVVKVENTVNGSPQYGLDKADMVLEELVEGGLTRLAAFYYSDLPTKVGHVRSLRTSDIGIAGPVGGQIVASGGANRAYNKVEGAGITVFSEDAGSAGFSSDPLKSRPYNRLINLQTVNKNTKANTVNGPYLPWAVPGAEAEDSGKTPAASGATPSAPAAEAPKTATKATVRFSPSTSTTWALKGDRWSRTNGHAEAGKDFEADTMIVLKCKVGDAGYRDPAGNPVPETIFEGSGEGTVFHGDQVTEVTWLKPSLEEGLTFKTSDGQAFELDPGRAFIELVPKDGGAVALG